MDSVSPGHFIFGTAGRRTVGFRFAGVHRLRCGGGYSVPGEAVGHPAPGAAGGVRPVSDRKRLTGGGGCATMVSPYDAKTNVKTDRYGEKENDINQ